MTGRARRAVEIMINGDREEVPKPTHRALNVLAVEIDEVYTAIRSHEDRVDKQFREHENRVGIQFDRFTADLTEQFRHLRRVITGAAASVVATAIITMYIQH